MARPTILLLDEPTNHLDAEGRTWLKEAIALHQGIGVLVSYDRALLDEVTSATLWVETPHVSLYPLPYTDAAMHRAQGREQVQ